MVWSVSFRVFLYASGVKTVLTLIILYINCDFIVEKKKRERKFWDKENFLPPFFEKKIIIYFSINFH